MKRHLFVTPCTIALLGFSLSALVAFEFGAGAGLSGGPAGYQAGQAGNCTRCHVFEVGVGGVELSGAPRRYRTGAIYDLSVHISDAERLGAGFEISAEGGGGHIGGFQLSDTDSTKNAGSSEPIQYVTHTRSGFGDSVDNWVSGGGAYAYELQWAAPSFDDGPVTFFVSANTAHQQDSRDGEHFYATFATAHYAIPGDADGDNDLDLQDFATLQRCFDKAGAIDSDACRFVDLNADEWVVLNDAAEFAVALTGPTTSLPADYILADVVRGGRLYDKWWAVSGAAPPTENHPLWETRPDKLSNTLTGAATWRCKECHGWDYKGVDGVYGDPANSHRTGFGGVLGISLSPGALFDLLKADDPAVGGHDMDAAGMSDRDLWDVVKMVLVSAVDTDQYIDGNGAFLGDTSFGLEDYGVVCSSCHGPEGFSVPGVDLASVAQLNPWEFLHKARFGQPGAPMPAFELLGWGTTSAVDVGAYAATLAP